MPVNHQTPDLIDVSFKGWTVTACAGVRVTQQTLRRGGVKRMTWLCRCLCGKEQFFTTTYIMPKVRIWPDKCRHFKESDKSRKIRNVGLKAIETMIAKSGLVDIIKEKRNEKD